MKSPPNESQEEPEKGRTPDATEPEEKPQEIPEDEVDEAGEESFPASDPPAWAPDGQR